MKKILESQRLFLRPMEASDHQDVFRALSHPDVIKYYGVSYTTYEATQEQMDWYANLEHNNTGMWWAVCDRQTKVFLGAGGLNDVNHGHKKAEIGFWLLPEAWGKGLMTEAMPLICSYGFNVMNLHRIEGFVESENIPCKRAMAKLNFQYEGRMKDCEIKNGVFISVDIYSLLNNN